MKAAKPYAPEFPELAGRFAMEHRDVYRGEAAALTALAGKLGYSADRLCVWIRQVQCDGGEWRGQTAGKSRMNELECKVRELCQANEILTKASAYFSHAEIDRPLCK